MDISVFKTTEIPENFSYKIDEFCSNVSCCENEYVIVVGFSKPSWWDSAVFDGAALDNEGFTWDFLEFENYVQVFCMVADKDGMFDEKSFADLKTEFLDTLLYDLDNVWNCALSDYVCENINDLDIKTKLDGEFRDFISDNAGNLDVDVAGMVEGFLDGENI